MSRGDVIALLRGFILVGALGALLCATLAVWALSGISCILTDPWNFPLFVGAGVILGAAILALNGAGVAQPGPAYLEWMWEHVPKPMLVMTAAAFVFSVFLARSEISDRLALQQCADAAIGSLSSFYVLGTSILVGVLRDLNQSK